MTKFRKDPRVDLPAGALNAIAKIDVLHVFWRTDDGQWHVRGFELDQDNQASEFAVAHGTFVIASQMSVPRMALGQEWIDGLPR